jgi:hypothetical protein
MSLVAWRTCQDTTLSRKDAGWQFRNRILPGLPIWYRGRTVNADGVVRRGDAALHWA